MNSNRRIEHMFEQNQLSAMDFEAMSDEGLIEALRAVHGAAAAAQAAEVFAVRELYRRHRAASAEPGPGGVRAGEFAAAEAAVGLFVDEGTAAALIDIGLVLEEALPRTRVAFAAGRIDLAKVRVIVDSTRALAKEVVDALEPRLLEAAARTNPARLRQAARRWANRLDPAGTQRRRERRQEDRDVRIRAVQDSMAVFDGLLPAPGAQTVAMRLREMSLQVCANDPRTMPQRRADALVALADGSGRLCCRCGRGERCPKAGAPVEPPRRPLIQIGIAADTLLDMREAPAFLAGYGPIDAGLARSLAEHASFQVVPEHIDGDATDEAPRRVASEIRAVDGMCRFPGCTIPAAEGQLERSGGGLAVLCSRHGRLKTLADKRKQWRVWRADRDRLQWTAPNGEVHTTVREGARYLFPHSDIELPTVGTAEMQAVSSSTGPTYVGDNTSSRARRESTEPRPSSADRRTDRNAPITAFTADRPTGEELLYPLDGHIPLHRQLARIAPENDIPDDSSTQHR
ncbi:uncharacterized protein DUF222 [Nocardia bhagyanarayanae]|uniref:Uncharacterized protein DUF222 n=1 Tax=Nocardia bhagyanarayanae TaxID=1215925 RepID=A0A543FB81_9NOCA|nr:uncharacterized protein DUF222 [Nocardia bhagyanarayanae]